MELPKMSNYLSEVIQRQNTFSQLTDYSVKLMKETFESFAYSLPNMYKKCMKDYSLECDLYSSCIKSLYHDIITLNCVVSVHILNIKKDEETISKYNDITQAYFNNIDKDLLTNSLIEVNPRIKYVCRDIKDRKDLTEFVVQLECNINSIEDVDFLNLKLYETIRDFDNKR